MIAWHDLDWRVTRSARVERYYRVLRKQTVWRRGLYKQRRRVHVSQRKKYKKPIRWTIYRAYAKQGALYFAIERLVRDQPYTAIISMERALIASAQGATPRAAHNAAIKAAQKSARAMTRALKPLTD